MAVAVLDSLFCRTGSDFCNCLSSCSLTDLHSSEKMKKFNCAVRKPVFEVTSMFGYKLGCTSTEDG